MTEFVMGGAGLGMGFEAELQTTHEEYARNGLALIQKLEVRKVGTRWGIRYVGRMPCDFTGVLKGGRFVAFDAKSLSRPAKNRRPDPRQAHQLAYLLDVARLGGLAFYLVRNGPDEACVVWAEQLAGGEKVELRLCLTVRRRYSARPWDWLRMIPLETDGGEGGDGERQE